MTNQVKADLMLLLVTLLWGFSYWLMDISLAEIGTFNLNAMRFIIAFLFAVIFSYKKMMNLNKATIRYAALLGFILMIAYIGATYGVKYTSISNAGFLIALAVVITPVLGFFFKGQKPGKKLIIVVFIALVGIALLTLNEELRPAAGDLLCILSAFGSAVHLLVVETAVRKEEVDAFQLGILQLGFTGLYMLTMCFIVETPHFPYTQRVWVSVLVLAVFCTGLSFIVQTVAQQYTSASHVGVIYSLEPVFAGFVAFFLAGEVLSVREYCGAALLMSGIFIMEIDLQKFIRLFRKKITSNQ